MEDGPALATRRYPGRIERGKWEVPVKTVLAVIGGAIILALIAGAFVDVLVDMDLILELLINISIAVVFISVGWFITRRRQKAAYQIWLEDFYVMTYPKEWPTLGLMKVAIDRLRAKGFHLSLIYTKGFEIPPATGYKAILVGYRVEPGGRQIYILEPLKPAESVAKTRRVRVLEPKRDIVITPIEKPYDLAKDPIVSTIAGLWFEHEMQRVGAGHPHSISDYDLMGTSRAPTYLAE